MMYFYKKKWTKLVLLLSLLSSTTLMADYINLRGTIVKVQDNGQEEVFKNVRISIKNSTIQSRTYQKGNFDMKKNSKDLKAGDPIQLTISDARWFIISPFDGKMFLPNRAQNIKVRVISKSSRVYAALFKTVRDYNIQIVSTYNEAYAIDTVNALRRDHFKDVYYEAYAKGNVPKNGFFYKVKVGHYKNKTKAIKDLLKIRKKYKAWKDAFLTVHTQILD